MAKTFILLLTLVVAAFGQTSVNLSAKYPQVISYKVRPDVLLTATFAADGQACEMTLEKREKTDSGIVFGVSFSEKEVRRLVDDLIPKEQRGKDLTRVLNENIDGDFITTEYTYENVLVRIYGIIRPAGAAGDRVIIITWPKRPCGNVQSETRPVERCFPECPPVLFSVELRWP